jgi:Phage tail tube protein
MAFASGGYHGLYYVAEASFGVTPANPVWTPLRHTTCNLQLKRDKFECKELRSDRAVTDIRLGVYKCEGDVGFCLMYGGYDTILEALLGGTWTANVLKQGTTQRSFSILRRYADIAQYQVFSGCVPNKLTLDLKASGEIVMGTINFIGANMTAALPAGSTYAAADTNTPMDSFSASVMEGGVPSALVSAITLTLENGIEANYVVGSKYAAQVTWGRSVAAGKITAFFEDLVMFNKFLNETASSLVFVTSDGGTKTLTWALSNLKYTSADNPATDEKPIQLEMAFDALHDAVNTNLMITRNPTSSPSQSVSPSASYSPSSSPSRSPSRSPSASPSV